MLQIKVSGLASLAQDVMARLGRATIASVSVLGSLARQGTGRGQGALRRHREAGESDLRRTSFAKATTA